MTTSLRNRFCWIAVLFSSLCLCPAQLPSGQISVAFDNTTAPVWDFQTTLVLEQTMQSAGDQSVPLNYSVEVTHDPKGKLRGSGFTILNIDNDFVAAQYTVNGKVSGGGDTVNRASFTVKLSGEDIITGISTRFSVNLHYKLEADVDQLAFVGTVRGSANFSGISSARIDSDVTLGLAPTMDGSWVLDMNLLVLDKIGGTANIVLSDGRVLPTQVNGSYSSSSGVTKIKLKGINEGKGTSLNARLINVEDTLVIERLNGKILGQSVRQ